jgi:serine/threonine protein kinase
MFLIHLSSRNDPTALPAGDLILVGRGEQCDIRLEDPSASRVHCRLLSRGGKVILTDAGSRWGTFVNGQRVTDCELQPGDVITIGETTLRLAATSTPEASTLARPSQLRRGDLEPIESDRPQSPEIPRRKPSRRKLPSRLIGETIAGCRLEELVATTRSGRLYRATRGGESVAFKLLQSEAYATDSEQQRFLRGIETVRNLRHPAIVSLLDGGMIEGVPYAVSELILGESAAEMISRVGVAGMLDWRTTLRIARDIASALEFLASQGVLHRNITPQHILIRSSDGSARLCGLLLSKSLAERGPAVTASGETVGELPYLSPEQVGSGPPVDHRTDIYQLGATLYALLTGRPPFEGRGPAEIIQQVIAAAPAPPTRYHLSIPPQLEGAVLTMLAKRPEDRFATAADLTRTLERVQRFTA